jgi:hypothetical protein
MGKIAVKKGTWLDIKLLLLSIGIPLFIFIAVLFNFSDKTARRVFWPCIVISYCLLGWAIWAIKYMVDMLLVF